MDLLDRLTSACLTRIVHSRIERHVADTCKGNFTVSHLARPIIQWKLIIIKINLALLLRNEKPHYSYLSFPLTDLVQARLEEWLDAVVMGFIRTLYSDPAGTLAVLHSFRRRLGNHLYETYTRARIEQLFNVIIEFPDSSVCTRKTTSFYPQKFGKILPLTTNI